MYTCIQPLLFFLLFLSLPLSLSLSLTRAHTYTRIQKLSRFLSHSLTLSNRRMDMTIARQRIQPIFLLRFLSPSLSRALSLSLTHTQHTPHTHNKLTLSHVQSLSQTHRVDEHTQPSQMHLATPLLPLLVSLAHAPSLSLTHQHHKRPTHPHTHLPFSPSHTHNHTPGRWT